MTRAPKACLDCGAPTHGGSRCDRHQATEDVRLAQATEQRHEGMWWREVRSSSVYRTNRRIRIQKAGGRCERIIDGVRCPAVATEADHTIPLSQARSLREALDFSRWNLLEAVCSAHNPRGG